uniref:Uncharacterized protein n=1 Tax=Anguilla anguilla TaxID=7936 RepID=A0A0E9RVL3_ANGAN
MKATPLCYHSHIYTVLFLFSPYINRYIFIAYHPFICNQIPLAI